MSLREAKSTVRPKMTRQQNAVNLRSNLTLIAANLAVLFDNEWFPDLSPSKLVRS